MEGVAYCTASNYNLRHLEEFWSQNYPTKLHRDVLEVNVPALSPNAVVFYFSFGAMVAWDLSVDDCAPFLNEVIHIPTGIDPIEVDHFTFSIGESSHIVKEE